MRPALIEDYKNPTYRALARSVLTNFLLEDKRIPFVAGMDSSIVHYKPWSSIVFNPKVEDGWKAILENYYNSDEYRILNESVAGDPLLSKYATIQFLNTLFEKGREELKRIRPDSSSEELENPIDTINRLLSSEEVPIRIKEFLAEALVSDLRKEAERIRRDVEVVESFSLIGVPVAEFLDKPDEFREMVRNKIVVYLVKLLRRAVREAPSLKQTKMPTLIGGRPLGVKRIQRWSELSRVLPLEYLDDDLLAYKIASRTLRVSEQYGGIQNYVVYIDKSGSMAQGIRYYTSPVTWESVPKISFATASALALAWRLRQVGAKMTLKFFDVEVHDPISDFKDILDALLRVRAGSGTNLEAVIEDAMNHHLDERVIMITDAIGYVPEDLAKRAKGRGLDLTCVFIKSENEVLRRYFNCVHLREAKPDILLKI